MDALTDTKRQAAERIGTMRTPFRCGFLVWPAIQNVVNYGRAHGLDVEVHASGRVFKRGWIVARGSETPLRRMGLMFDELTRELGRDGK